MSLVHHKKIAILNAFLIFIFSFIVRIFYIEIDLSFDVSIMGRGKYLSLSNIDSCILFTKQQYYKMICVICLCAFVAMLTNYIYLLMLTKKNMQQSTLSANNKKRMILNCVAIFVINTAIVLIMCFVCRHQINGYVMSNHVTMDQIPIKLRSYYLNLLYLLIVFLGEWILVIYHVLKKHVGVLEYSTLFITFTSFFLPMILMNPYLFWLALKTVWFSMNIA